MGTVAMVFLIDDRYPNVEAVGAAVRTVLPVEFERRSSDYLGGDYLLYRAADGCVMRIRNDYSSFLDEWYTGGEAGNKYVLIIERYKEVGAFATIANLPGFRLKEADRDVVE
jgi:hypothetical protein